MSDHVFMDTPFADDSIVLQYADAGKRFLTAQFILHAAAEQASRYPDDTLTLKVLDNALAEVARRRAIKEACGRRYETWKKDHTL